MDLELDRRIRLTAFAHLEQLQRRFGEVIPRTSLLEGFAFEGRRVPLMSPQQGIFKPAVMEMPLSLVTAPVLPGRERPYDDAVSDDGIHYRYRGTDPNHRDNAGVRLTMVHGVPLVYFHGVVPGQYAAAFPVYVVHDNPPALTFTLLADDRVAFSATVDHVADDSREMARRYITATVQKRLHQRTFRQRVVAAYRQHCAVCRLRHDELLDAAHILPDGHPRGVPSVPNGIALCKLHHAAFDAHILGVTPDYEVEVRDDVLNEIDGPMLLHGLQGFHGLEINVPRSEFLKPSRDFLAERYELFKAAR